jgi:hypothetical protein
MVTSVDFGPPWYDVPHRRKVALIEEWVARHRGHIREYILSLNAEERRIAEETGGYVHLGITVPADDVGELVAFYPTPHDRPWRCSLKIRRELGGEVVAWAERLGVPAGRLYRLAVAERDLVIPR